MADTHENNADNMDALINEYAETVIHNLYGMRVDLSWLEGHDFDLITAIDSYVTYRACKAEIMDEDSLYVSAEDMVAHAEGIAHPISGVLSLYRDKHEENEELFSIIYLIASLAYQHGVRDAGTGRLTKETVDRIVKRRARADERRQAMRDLYDDLRES